MKREELTPIEELAFNYAKSTLKEDIKLEDIHSIHIEFDLVKICFNADIEKRDIFIELEDLGIEFDKKDEYEKEVYTSSINHVVRLVRNDLVTRKATPLLSDLLKLKEVQEKWLDYFKYQTTLFYRDITGYYRYIETISIDNNNIYFTDIYSGKEYSIPLELLSLPTEEAKEKYVDILKNEEKSQIEKEKRKIESDIENYKNLLRESEEKLRELITKEGENNAIQD